MAKPLHYFCCENLMNRIEKGKRYDTRKIEPSGQKLSIMLLGKSGGQLLTAPGRMKQPLTTRNNTQSCGCVWG